MTRPACMTITVGAQFAARKAVSYYCTHGEDCPIYGNPHRAIAAAIGDADTDGEQLDAIIKQLQRFERWL